MVNADGLYMQSFGFMQNETVYSSVDVKSLALGSESAIHDMRQNMFGEGNVGLKALNTETGGAGTAGYALIPVYVDDKIIDQSRKSTPLTEIIPRVTNRGMTADYNVITSKGSAFTYAEGSALATVDDTYDRGSVGIKSIGIVGEVTGQAQAAIPSYVLGQFAPGQANEVQPSVSQSAPNGMQLEVLAKARSLKEKEENLIVNGDASTTSTEFSGFIKLIDKGTGIGA